MNRRSFLGMIAAAPIAAKLAPLAKLVSSQPVITNYYDFVSFSEYALETAIDPVLLNVATELAHVHRLRIDALCLGHFA